MKYPILATTALVGLFAASPAFSQSYPSVSGEAVFELQNEYTANSDDSDTDGYNNAFARTEVAPQVNFNENFYVNGVFVLEPLRDFDAHENNYFESEGIFAEELKFHYDRDNWGVFAGKFNPGFGIAWDYGRGIWGEDFAEDYEITERLGFGGSYTLGNENLGAHTLTASTFFADTTFLSGATVTDRDQLDKDDGGVSNTEDFSSYVVSIDGEDLFGHDGLYYKLGYRHQAQGDADTGGDDENGYVVTLGHNLQAHQRLEIDTFFEFTDISNFEAGNDDYQYITASIGGRLDDHWIATASWTDRNIDVDGGDDVDDTLLQLSGGYDFGQGTTFELGYRYSEEDNSDRDIIGGLVRHSIEF